MKKYFADYVVPSAGQVLETMFFTGVEAVAEQTSFACDETIARTVRFEGPPNGEFCVGLPHQTAAALASSFLGLDPEEISTSDCEQIAEELANMICGSVLSHYAPQGSFHLEGIESSACERECDFCVSLELPEGGLNICARIDPS
jgi:hypothetical protein